jgi:hypothetical protein
MVFRSLTLSHIDDLDYDWDVELRKVLSLTAAALNWLIIHVDEEFGATSFIKNTFTNPIRCRTLVQRVLSDMATGDAAPDLPPGYGPTAERKLRRQNAVHTLVDAGWIREGTALTFKTRVSRERDAVDSWLGRTPSAPKLPGSTIGPGRFYGPMTASVTRPLAWLRGSGRWPAGQADRSLYRAQSSGTYPAKVRSRTSLRPSKKTTNQQRMDRPTSRRNRIVGRSQFNEVSGRRG